MIISVERGTKNVDKRVIKKIEFLMSTIPKELLPQNGIPTIHVTNSLFHSYGVMYQKYSPTGEASEEEFFDFCRKQNVWAITCLQSFGNGDTYLSINDRLTKNIYARSVEHAIFHEIGHLYYYQNGIGLSSTIDTEHESLADIYANACIVNLILNYKKYSLIDTSKNYIKETVSKHVKRRVVSAKKIMEIGEKIFRKDGVL